MSYDDDGMCVIMEATAWQQRCLGERLAATADHSSFPERWIGATSRRSVCRWAAARVVVCARRLTSNALSDGYGCLPWCPFIASCSTAQTGDSVVVSPVSFWCIVKGFPAFDKGPPVAEGIILAELKRMFTEGASCRGTSTRTWSARNGGFSNEASDPKLTTLLLSSGLSASVKRPNAG